MSKKTLALIICFALLGTLLIGCGSKIETTQSATTAETKTEPATTKAEAPKIAGNILWSSHRTDFQNTLLPQYVEEFKKKYPDVKVTIETYKEYKESMKIKMSANDMPDIWTVGGGDYTRDQIQANALPLDDLEITKDFDGLDPFKGNDGKVYALPTGLGATGVVYNKKIFSELGITVPKTLDEFIAAAKKISASGKVGLATAAKAKWPLQFFWGAIPRIISGDPEVINKCALVDEPFTPDNPVVKGWTILKKWSDEKIIEKDPLSADWEPMKKEFRAGNVGMFLLGNWFIPQAIGEALKEEDVGFFPFPYDNDPGAKNVAMGPDVAWAMGNNSKNPEAQKAFFMFLTDTKYADWAKQTGLLSARKSIKVEMGFVTEFESFNPKKLFDKGETKELNDVVSKAQFDKDAFAQQILAGKDFNKLLADLNAKWKKARGN